ncbi:MULTISPECIES: restriction endonuclease subunit S [unclassified Neorhizobium]|uniref:restriction endonuclease subunit S n=1 Tax=unclassified Neorhizobium TaxID=2629175 RepID=UPI001FF2684F|nr:MULTISPECIES: restriction endonuclease subunit S [unclassified Neorhizobium]MCJ9669019.1 restriction endonuclease subunit S [Neorhizobium sp. SHOUNA12B]MCJ9744973.1 restriction endonuclease subunit S [Neorhizobium sp. SHOUNA12A]
MKKIEEEHLFALRLAEVAEVFAGVGVSREETIERPGDKLPVIGVRDLQDGAVSPIERLDTVGFHDRNRAVSYAVRENDVLVTGRGTVLKFGLVGSETAGAVASGNVIVIRPKPPTVGGALFAILSSDVFRPKIEVLRRGATTLLSLSPKDLAKIEIDLPSVNEQQRIAALVTDTQTAYRTAIEAAEIRRALAHRLIDARLFGTNKQL